MKTNPESLVVDETLCLKYKSFFISGNDEAYIFALMSLLIKRFLNNGYIRKNLTGEDGAAPDLFKSESKYIYVC